MNQQTCFVQLPETLAPDKEFIAQFEKNVVDTVQQFGLLRKGEKLLVAVSGGKDSTTILYLLHKLGYPLEAITIDAKIGCYSEQNVRNITSFCSSLGIKLHQISFRDAFGGSLCYLQDVLKENGIALKSCTTCGVLRRYLISIHAKRLGADKIVTGHNRDDEVQALLMNYMKNNLEKCAAMGPLVGFAGNKSFVPRAKPFFLTAEKDIVRYAKMHSFPVKYAVCPCASGGYRYTLRDFLRGYEASNPRFQENIIQHFLALLPALKKKYASRSFQHCTSCGEPSRESMCRTCQIIAMFKSSSVKKDRYAELEAVEHAV